MQDNNNGNDKSPKDAGDEILEILDNYRKNNPAPEQPSKKEQAQNPLPEQKGSGDSPSPAGGDLTDADLDMTPLSVLSHFTDEESPEDSDRNPLGAHLTGTIDEKELKKAKRKSAERLTKEKTTAGSIAGAIGKSSFLLKALVYIIVVLIVSAYLSYYIITIGNDVFALVKDSGTVIVSIPENATAEQVTDILREKGIIDYGWVFKLYLKYRSDGEFDFLSGDHELELPLNYTRIIEKLTVYRTERKVLRIVIPEGYTVDQIIDLFLENGIGTREGFVDAINNYPYKHEFVKLLKPESDIAEETSDTSAPDNTKGYVYYSADRKYRLEGYLFPDTYDFYQDTKEHLVINKLLNNFNEKFWKPYKTEHREKIEDEYGMTFDDMVVLASMVQAEGNNALDFEYMSYVFHNRLFNPPSKDLKKLQSDATIQYFLNERKEDLTFADTEIEDPYNTYLHEGLPPGAICNPGIDAITAAIYPDTPKNSNDESVNAYYFVSNKAGKTYYAKDKSGHDRNTEQVKKDNIAIDEGTFEG